jgi:hypothetical protein
VFQGGDIDGNTGSGVREDGFIKNDITGNINTARGAVETLVPLVHRAIPQEDTHRGSERQLASIVLPQARPTSASKNTEKGVVGLDFEKAKERGILL